MNDTACVFGSKFRMRGLANEVLCMAFTAAQQQAISGATDWGCGHFPGLIYVVGPRLSRHSMGLR